MGCRSQREGKAQLSEAAMRSIGIDLHKRSLTVCVIDKVTGETFISRFLTADEARIRGFFEKQRPFEAAVEASATYEWLWVLLEPLAARLVLAHPSKLRIIAESKKKTDRFDARALAHLLAQDEVPEAYRPLPQQREYQHLVKHRVVVVQQRSRLRTQIRSVLSARNLDRPDLFRHPKEWFCDLALPSAEKFRVLELLSVLEVFRERIKIATKQLKIFREAAPEDQRRNHEIVKSVPGVGDLTADVVLASLGPVDRFRTIEKVTAYSGLVPGSRRSDRRVVELGITKEGPRILRWALVEAAWRATRNSEYWKQIFDSIAKRRGRKKAVVAVARRLLGVIYTLLRKGELYTEKLSPRRSSPGLSRA
jgi:transposase